MAGPKQTPTLVLASSSPRRRDLLADLGVPFCVVEPPLEEPSRPAPLGRPSHLAEALAYFKARSVAETLGEEWVLGADTIVAVDGEVLGKPIDIQDARAMLRKLSGSRHVVITGIALLGPEGRRVLASCATWVTMRPMTDEELQAYLDSGEWEGKAGAYAIQETADRFVTNVEGSFSNVVGLPVEAVAALTRGLPGRTHDEGERP